MSDKKTVISSNEDVRKKVSAATIQDEFVDLKEKNQCLITAIYDVTSMFPFVGGMLQSLNIMYSHTLPTAGVAFNNELKRWDLFINPFFFCKKLTSKNRTAVLLHEISHITHKHPFRVPFIKISSRKRMIMNIAADMAINQFIKDLPSGCNKCPPIEARANCEDPMCPGRAIDVAYYKDEKDGAQVPWPRNKTMEFYYEKLLTKFDDPENDSDDEGNDSDGPGEGDGTPGKKGIPKTLDDHNWDGSASEKDMLEATEDLIKRVMIKQSLSSSDLPGHIKDLLQEIDARKSELNYRAMIMSALKRHASGHDRKHTWTRVSKRFGAVAPGTKVGDLPKLNLYLDTSGSISIEELNEFLLIVDNFLRVGSRKCNLSFFHTENYGHRKYKLGSKVNREDIQSGGTELTPVMEDILKNKADLSIIVTDGCYGDVEVETMMKPGQKFPQTLFIISAGGTDDHPLKRLGETVKVPNNAK